jgi:hypothetical protein
VWIGISFALILSYVFFVTGDLDLSISWWKTARRWQRWGISMVPMVRSLTPRHLEQVLGGCLWDGAYL